MPGRPLLQELNAKIKADGGEDTAVFARIADGETVGSIARDYGVSRRMMYVWRDQHGHKERRTEKWESAMKLSAWSRVEDAEELLDELAASGQVITNVDVRIAEARANQKRWMASKLDRETFGSDSGGQQVVNIGELHLNALKSSSQRQVLESGEVEEADYELEE